ncbi:hypothetical protein F4780DRAFT_797454 [Xylariomycetidae sp. FL0641]|nr:hypothetical protein F4780DRAFT_797454 [Xylariomycetidae sp. FL0641]
MSHSLSALERENPPPRRKACTSCIKSKRRCDLRQPSCLRCSQRGIDCHYPPHTIRGHRLQREQTTPVTRSISPPNPAPEATPVSDEPFWMLPDFFLNTGMGQTVCAEFPSFSFDDHDMPSLSFLDDMGETEAHMDLTTPPARTEVTASIPQSVVQQPLSLPVTAGSPALANLISQVIDQRLRYAIDQLKQAPETMVMDMETPWCHPLLYQQAMPALMEEALSSCALYRAMNPRNEGVIRRTIQCKYQTLLLRSTPLDRTATTSGAREALARTQALLLYQIMLLFDGAHTARAVAEATLPALEDAARALLPHARFADDVPAEAPPVLPSPHPSAARARFAEYALHESLRRTLMTAFFVLQLHRVLTISGARTLLLARELSSSSSSSFTTTSTGYQRLTDDDDDDAVGEHHHHHHLRIVPADDDDDHHHHHPVVCDPCLGLCRSFTLSAHLWRARDAAAFAAAWRGRDHLVATPYDFCAVVAARAAPDDLDAFGRMLLTSATGVEETRGWMAERGGCL